MSKPLKSKEQMAADSAKQYAAADAEWKKLTSGDWPEEEHGQRFEALLKKAMLLPPIHKRRGR